MAKQSRRDEAVRLAGLIADIMPALDPEVLEAVALAPAPKVEVVMKSGRRFRIIVKAKSRRDPQVWRTTG